MIVCDRCKRQFNERLYEQTKSVEGNEVIRTYLKCPYCKEVYTVCYDTQATLALKKQIRKNTALLSQIKNETKYKNELKRIEKRQRRLSKEMKVVETKYKEEFEKERNKNGRRK